MSSEKIRPEGGEQKRPAVLSGGRLSGPSESRQERDLAKIVPAPGLPVPVEEAARLLAYWEATGAADSEGPLLVRSLLDDIERLRGELEMIRSVPSERTLLFSSEARAMYEYACRALAAAGGATACGRCGHVHPRSDRSVLTCECGCLAEGATVGD